tara:strand:+ start:176 stop:676 length:501 start_codon:yes stop_codon:yes gene_type:complete
MKYRHTFLAFVTTLGLFACSSQPAQDSTLRKTFVPEINTRDIKQFTYKVANLSSKRASTSRQKEANRGTKSLDRTRRNRNLATITQRKEKVILSLLEMKLAETAFCRDGYTITSSDYRDGYAEVNGQCKETATQQDKEKFPSTVSKNSIIKSNVIRNENFILNLPK